jgi:hypothetical protein
VGIGGDEKAPRHSPSSSGALYKDDEITEDGAQCLASKHATRSPSFPPLSAFGGCVGPSKAWVQPYLHGVARAPDPCGAHDSRVPFGRFGAPSPINLLSSMRGKDAHCSKVLVERM